MRIKNINWRNLLFLSGLFLLCNLSPCFSMDSLSSFLFTVNPSGSSLSLESPEVKQAKGWDSLILGDQLTSMISSVKTSSHQDNGHFDVIQIAYPSFQTTHTVFVWSLKVGLPEGIKASEKEISEYIKGVLGFEVKLNVSPPASGMSEVKIISGNNEETVPWKTNMKAYFDGTALYFITLKSEGGISSSRPSMMPEMNTNWFR
ncbi:MAG: hypothetical protein IAE94_04380 [Chthoniobacterales bacterium]|nr:hypothetical protein [Chthoniobacterales bacterium]